MASTFENDLRLEEIGTGEQSGTWGATTNTNLELIAEAFSYGTEAITTNADTHDTVIADGATDEGRSMYLKYTGTLDSTCTITISAGSAGTFTLSKVWMIENATSGGQSIIITSGSGASVTIANGQVKMIATDGAGSGGIVYDILQDIAIPDLFVDDDFTLQSDGAIINFGADSDVNLTHVADTGLLLNSTRQLQFGDSGTYIHQSADGVLDLVSDTEIEINATTIDINGNVDISGTTVSTGKITADAGIDIDNFNIDGTTIALSSGDMLLDGAGDIILDADGGDVLLKDDGTQYASFTNTSGDLIIKSGSTTAMTFSGANVTFAGTVTIGSAGISEAELEILDGATVTTAELNILDGDTSATSTTVVDADRVVLNDNGTMVQVAVTDLATYFASEITAMSNLTSVGTLTTLTVDNVIINGTTIGHTSDTDLITLANGIATVAGEISVTTLDIGGTNVSATAGELNIMDGDTSATSTTLADADRVVVNDNGTMVQVALTDFETYFESALDTLSNVTTVGALDSGSITSGFGAIDNGTSGIRSNTVTVETSLLPDTASGADIGSTSAEFGDVYIGDDKYIQFGSDQDVLVGYDEDGDDSLEFRQNVEGAALALTFKADQGDDDDDQWKLNFADGGTVTFQNKTSGSYASKLTIDKDGDVTIAGDLTVSGDDITMATNTSGNLLIADGTNFNSVAVGSLSEISSVANDDVFLAVDTSGGGLKKITRSTIVSGLAVSGAAISNVVEDTTPQLGGNLDTNDHNILIDDAHFIGDENGNEQIIFQTTASAVNQLDVTNAATGNAPEISATGGDTNISLKLTPKGTGQVLIDGNVGIESGLIDLKNPGSSRSQIKFYCESGNQHAQALQGAPHGETASNTLTLPSTGGDVDLVSTASTATLTNKTFGDDVSFSDNNITNVGDIALDSISADGTDINVAVSDNSATALTIKQGSDAYLIIDTANSSESVSIGTGVSGTAITLGHSTSEVTVSDNLTVTGNLTVSGTTTTVDTTNTTIKDNLLELNSGASSNSNDVGIIIQRGSTGNDALIMWDESEDKWALGTTTSSAGDTGNLNMTAGTLVANLEGNVTGNVTGTLQTAAQTNITSLGTLTALTVDDVAVDGKVITMTGSSGDTAVFTVGTNGTLSIVTTDASAAAANIQITADGTAELAGTTVTLDSGGDIELEATNDINIPANVGLTFGDDAEKIEGDGTDLTISGNNINLTAAADVVIPANVGITFGSGEKIEGNNTDLTVTSGADINLTAGADVNIPADVGITFGDDGEKIEGDGTDLTVSSSNDLTLDVENNITIDANGGTITFSDNGSSLGTITSSGYSGNAGTATTLATARTIGGVSFDGSANINLPGVNTAGNQNTSGSAATLTTARTIGGVSFDGSANINLPGVNTSGNQDTSGNAATATALATARTINGTSFDGTGNITLGNGSVTHAMLAGDAVDGDNIADDSINSEHYVNGSIDHAHLANDCVDGDNIADDSINSEHYVNASIDHAHLANDCVDGDNIANDSINSEHYVDGSIDTAHIADLNVTQAKIANEAINEAKLQVSNAPTNGYYLQAQSGNTGGLTWAAVATGTPTTVANFGTGSRNVGIGNNVLAAMVSNNITTMNNVTAVGHDALASTDEDLDDITAIGAYAGKNIKKFSILTGYGRHTVVGMKAGMNHVLAGFNTAVGVEAYRGYDGSNADGVSSSVTGGAGNVVVGAYAFRGYSTAGYNTCIGFNTMAFSGSNGFTGTNNIAIGQSAKNSAYNTSHECTLGNNSTNNLRCADTSISSLSDRRDKTEIVDSPYGLNFLNSLRPVQFKWQRRKLEDYENAQDYVNPTDGKTRVGFIAQELQAAQNAVSETTKDVLNLVQEGNPRRLEAKQGNLIPVIVKALQELSTKVDNLTNRVTALE